MVVATLAGVFDLAGRFVDRHLHAVLFRCDSIQFFKLRFARGRPGCST